MLSAVSFLVLKTHLEPIIFAFGGAFSSLQVPAAFNVANSSWITFFHSSQSGHHFASISKWGLSALVSAVLAVNPCSRPSKSSGSTGDPSVMVHTVTPCYSISPIGIGLGALQKTN